MRSGSLPPLLFFALAAVLTVTGLFPPSVTPPSIVPSERDGGTSSPPRRVLFSANALSPFITVDNSISRIIAVLRYNAGNRENEFLLQVFPALGKIPQAGMGLSVDPEEVMLHNPDTVISWAGRDPILQEIGFPGLVELRNDGNASTLWNCFGRLLGKETRAAALWERREEHWRTLQAQTAQARIYSSPRVLLLIGGMRYGYWLAPRHRSNDYLEMAGADVLDRRLLGGGPANLERVLELDPDILFLESSGTGDRLVPRQLYEQPEWQAVRAVRERRIYKMPSLPGITAPVEDPIRLQWISEILYPDTVSARTREEARATFFAVYDYRLGNGDIDRMLYLPENAGSAGYERFQSVFRASHTFPTPPRTPADL